MNERRFEIFRLNEDDVARFEAQRDEALARGASIVDFFAGCLTHLYPDPEDTRRFLDEGRGYGDEDDYGRDD